MIVVFPATCSSNEVRFGGTGDNTTMSAEITFGLIFSDASWAPWRSVCIYAGVLPAHYLSADIILNQYRNWDRGDRDPNGDRWNEGPTRDRRAQPACLKPQIPASIKFPNPHVLASPGRAGREIAGMGTRIAISVPTNYQRHSFLQPTPRKAITRPNQAQVPILLASRARPGPAAVREKFSREKR